MIVFSRLQRIRNWHYLVLVLFNIYLGGIFRTAQPIGIGFVGMCGSFFLFYWEALTQGKLPCPFTGQQYMGRFFHNGTGHTYGVFDIFQKCHRAALS